MINEVLEQLTYLKLKSAYIYLKELHINDQITASELKGLYKVLKKEVIAKDENNKLYNVKVAGFPFLRKLDDYDFSFQPTVSEDKIRAIGASNFYDEGTNIVFIGNPGVGKTHLAISIGYEVAIKRNSVYFIKFNKLIMILKNAYHEGTFDKRVKHFFKYKLLIIDEVGFNEITPLEAKLFFQLIDLRYTKRSTIFTSNMTFDKWPQILGNDEMITKAILDRILHYSYLFNISGPSYRIKDKLRMNKTEES
ncbi:MAG: transposase [Tenericutes bacterium HGW-Tenericutes-3]|nr:MAG: transposase [Tenericutes bacterium HGW-Tenericutes-3]